VRQVDPSWRAAGAETFSLDDHPAACHLDQFLNSPVGTKTLLSPQPRNVTLLADQRNLAGPMAGRITKDVVVSTGRTTGRRFKLSRIAKPSHRTGWRKKTQDCVKLVFNGNDKITTPRGCKSSRQAKRKIGRVRSIGDEIRQRRDCDYRDREQGCPGLVFAPTGPLPGKSGQLKGDY